MNIKPYWNYFIYVLEHKKNVFIECWKDKQYLHAFTHDLSKFSKYEFTPYAEHFYGNRICGKCDNFKNDCYMNQIGLGLNNFAKECKDYKYKDFDAAWIHHYRNNPHHWNYWCDGRKDRPIEIPEKYIRQMICDWKAMGRKFGDTAQEYYLNNKDKIVLHENSRAKLEWLLKITQ